MSLDKLKEQLRQVYDEGRDLDGDLARAVADDAELQAYWRDLQALDSLLDDAPLEALPPGLTQRVKARVSEEAHPQTWSLANAGAACLALACVALAIGLFYPAYATPAYWYELAKSHVTVSPWPEAPAEQTLDAAAVWEQAAGRLEAGLELSGAPWYAIFLTGILALVVFNGWELARYRRAGSRRRS